MAADENSSSIIPLEVYKSTRNSLINLTRKRACEHFLVTILKQGSFKTQLNNAGQRLNLREQFSTSNIVSIFRNQEQLFVYLSGIKTFGKNKQWTLQLYYPHGQLRISEKSNLGRELHLQFNTVLRVGSNSEDRVFGFQILGFGLGIMRLSDKAFKEQQKLNEHFN